MARRAIENFNVQILNWSEELLDGLTRDGIDPVAGHFGERLRHESPITKTRMRHAQAGFVDDEVAVQDQVEVEGAGGVDVRPIAACRFLDGVQRFEQGSRAEQRAADNDFVEEVGEFGGPPTDVVS